jgi:hypothetical protein
MAEDLAMIGDLVAGGEQDRAGARCRIRGVRTLRQLPQAAEQPLGCAASEEDLTVPLGPQRDAGQQGQLVGGLPPRHHRELVLATEGAGAAQRRRQRAGQAGRRSRRADGGAELHQALVEVAGRAIGGQRGHDLAGALPEQLLAACRLHVVLDREDAGEHAGDVAVDQRRALAVGDRRDGARGVGADARHLAQRGRRPWQRAAMAFDDVAGAAVQVAGAAVVAEPGPVSEHVVERGVGQALHRREAAHPALPVRDDGGHPGLLQHDLRDPDRVRVAALAPGQVALHLQEVVDDRGGDLDIGAGRRRPGHGGAPYRTRCRPRQRGWTAALTEAIRLAG